MKNPFWPAQVQSQGWSLQRGTEPKFLQVMRDLRKRAELNDDRWLKWAEEAEHDDHLKHIYPVIWKFCELDVKPHDEGVSPHEVSAGIRKNDI